MDFSAYTEQLVSFVQDYPIVAVLIGLGLIVFMIRKPKWFFSIIFICLFFAGILYLISNLVTSGTEKKEQLLQQEEEQNNQDQPHKDQPHQDR